MKEVQDHNYICPEKKSINPAMPSLLAAVTKANHRGPWAVISRLSAFS